MTLSIENINLKVIQLPLKEPFKSSQGSIEYREVILVEVVSSGISGWGEAPALPYPAYNNETFSTTFNCLNKIAIPLILAAQPKSPEEAFVILSSISGNFIARASLEMALWDLHAKISNQPLFRLIGGIHEQIPSGVSLPLYSDKSTLLERASDFLKRGYKKIKIKISPGNEFELVNELCNKFPGIPLMVDANRSYSLSDMHLLKRLDDFNLMMIEEPLNGSLSDIAKLQESIKTPICLDESISTLSATKEAIELKSCKIINIKPTRVGGHTAAMLINNICKKNGIQVWCGGMLESGIGRAHNIALASLDNFSLPGDISESTRYFERDIIEPEIKLTHDGFVKLSSKAGIGYEVSTSTINKITTVSKVFKK